MLFIILTVYDYASFLLKEMWYDSADRVEDGSDVQVDAFIEFFLRYVQCRLNPHVNLTYETLCLRIRWHLVHVASSCIVHECIEATELVHRLINKIGPRGPVCHISYGRLQ